MNYERNTIAELNHKLVEGTTTSRELVNDSISKINLLNGDINAFIEVFTDTWVPEEVGDSSSSVLMGIPVGIKDNILIKGREATAASNILKGYRADYDAFVIEELKKHGAVFMGRLNMDEMAMGSSTETSFYGLTKNPLDLTRTPGGSSGGPAAAVASGMVSYSLGSDTGGSIRQPAALCGLVGLKPTYGSVSRRGLIALASSLDVIGPITNTVSDARTVFEAISGYDELDATCVPLAKRAAFQHKNLNRKVIGVPRKLLELDGIDEDARANFEQSLKAMEAAGYTVVDIEIPYIELALAVYYIIQPAEASSNLARFDGIRYGLHREGETLLDVYKNTKGQGFGEEVKRRIMLGTHVLSSGYHDEYYYQAQKLRRAITANINKVLDEVDVIATPTAPGVAFKLGEKAHPLAMYFQDIFTVPYNLSGHPALSVPSGVNHEGLPFGLHLVAPMFCEEKLLSIGEDVERAIL